MGEENEERSIDFGGDDEGSGKKKGKKKTKASSGGFQSMGLSFNVLKGILKRGYQVPTPIQRKTIPLLLTGKDVVAMARTGSGKTAAFLVPLLEKLSQAQQTIEIGPSKGQSSYPKAIILSPTRELALQTYKFAKDLSRHLTPPINIITILGGDSMDSQFELLHSKPQIVIATPGRFMHLCVEMELKLGGVETIIFDEADRLFEMGFGIQVNEIIQRLPLNRQTVLFSATMPKILVDFTKAGLTDPTLVRLDIETKLPENLQLVYLASRSEDKIVHLLYLLRNIIDIKYEQTIIFVATKYHVDYLHHILNGMDIANTYIYSSLDPSARKISLDKFRCRRANVLIVTDLAARGLDIPLLDNVINFHFPSKPKLFMHRVGRVARAGHFGTSYSIVSPDEIAYLLDLHLFLSRPLSLGGEGSQGTVLGRVPQEFIENEGNSLSNLFQNSYTSELDQLAKVSKNGYFQYIKSRPPASVESNRRAKGVLITSLPVNPTMFPHYKPDPLNTLIAQMQTFRPKSTIFEIGATKKGSSTTHTESHEIMKQKRLRDQGVIAKFRQQGKEEGHKSEVLEALGSAGAGSKDTENFINYLPLDHHTESGLAVGATANFTQQVQNSMMDLTGDDNEILKSQRTQMKWDSKKKKFVGSNSKANEKAKDGAPAPKRIKTESGAWIAASYKSNRYAAWKSKSKVDHQDGNESDGGGSDGEGGQEVKRGSVRNPFSNRGKPAHNNAGGPVWNRTTTNQGNGKRERKRPFRTEIKKPEVILKDRRVKEAKMKKNQKKGKGKKKGQRSGGGSKRK